MYLREMRGKGLARERTSPIDRNGGRRSFAPRRGTRAPPLFQLHSCGDRSILWKLRN